LKNQKVINGKIEILTDKVLKKQNRNNGAF